MSSSFFLLGWFDLVEELPKELSGWFKLFLYFSGKSPSRLFAGECEQRSCWIVL